MSQINKTDVINALPDYYLPYAQYVNQTRALPDARDCLKTGTRFILYSQYLEKLTHDKPRRKAVDTVSASMKFSVHGDAAILSTAVRLSQPFSLRYPLIETKGNNGSQLYGSGVHAAARYLEMRSNRLASEMTSLLSKNTIDNWELNYTQDKKYPVVLPTLFPNFVNGCTGIGVAMACSIPQFNLKEVCNSLIKYYDNPTLSFDELYCPIDFCTGGIIINEEEVKESLKNGTGKAAIIRAKATFDYENREIVVTELPYQVTSSQVVSQIQQCIEDGRLLGVEAVFDGSDIDGVRVCVKLSKTATPEKVLKTLYKETALQSHFSINMMMLKDGKYPQIYSFVDILDSYLMHMQSVVRKSYEYDLNEAKKRMEILEGYVKALNILDDVLNVIRNSSTKENASSRLQTEFSFSENQAKAILELKLQRLVNLEINKIQKEYEAQKEIVNSLEYILTNAEAFMNEIFKIIQRISTEYGDDRRTVNLSLNRKEDSEEIIEEKNLIIYFTNYGNLYADETTTLIAQKKGGRGNKIKMEKGEVIIKTITGKTSSPILIFTNKGNAYSIQFDELIGNTNINALLELKPDESVLEITTLGKTKYIIFITKNGLVKKSSTDIYNITKRGVIALKLVEEDSLVKVLFVNEEEIAILTHDGIFKIIESSSINPIGRVSQGVIGIKLNIDDYVVDAQIIAKDDKEIISITKEGLCARVSLDEFTVSGRATKGKTLQKGNLIGFILISSSDKEIAITSSKNIIKIPISSITPTNRGIQGTRAINLKDEQVTGVIKEL